MCAAGIGYHSHRFDQRVSGGHVDPHTQSQVPLGWTNQWIQRYRTEAVDGAGQHEVKGRNCSLFNSIDSSNFCVQISHFTGPGLLGQHYGRGHAEVSAASWPSAKRLLSVRHAAHHRSTLDEHIACAE